MLARASRRCGNFCFDNVDYGIPLRPGQGIAVHEINASNIGAWGILATFTVENLTAGGTVGPVARAYVA
jgi:hypothetical protein